MKEPDRELCNRQDGSRWMESAGKRGRDKRYHDMEPMGHNDRRARVGWRTLLGLAAHKKTAVSARLTAVGVPKKLLGKLQMLIFAPNFSTNLANHAGWAGQAGAVTRLPSTWAASMATATYWPPAKRISGEQAG